MLHYGPVPRVDLARWEFRVFGLVGEERRWSWEEFNQLPRTQVTLDIHCVTRWSKFDTLWEGVSVATLVKEGAVSYTHLDVYKRQALSNGARRRLRHAPCTSCCSSSR